MKKTFISSAILISMFGIAPQAFATEADVQQATGEGFYIGAGTGMGLIEESEMPAGSEHDAHALKLEGGYDFGNHFSVYGGYGYMNDFGLNEGANAELHIAEMGVKGDLNVTENLSMFGKVGGAYIFADNTDGDVFKKENAVVAAGVGLEYQLTHAVSTQVGYDIYADVEKANGGKTDLHQVYWGMSYKFGQPETPMVVTEEVVKTVEVVEEVPSRAHYVLPFQVGSSDINEYGAFNLNEVAHAMLANPHLQAELIGRTDTSGSDATNQRVSAARADAVADYLVSKGVESDRIVVLSVADQSPISQSDALLERSVEITLL
ncbi:OmpA family protein [Grimontia sp. SpTr1]|uniref:OmpA family protein n=1 Tax=Grimontia sp. SpTr1 TaxID=2995319 RepID=UPI00248C9A94|nr:OmpA family protein [Grimontia sp. SpTr1]